MNLSEDSAKLKVGQSWARGMPPRPREEGRGQFESPHC